MSLNIGDQEYNSGKKYRQKGTLCGPNNPIPHQWVMNIQQEMQPVPPQVGPYHNPNTFVDRTILLTSEEEVLLQTCTHQYRAPPESTPTNLEASLVPTGPPLMIPFPNIETPLCIPHIPL
jgi:hypothetical protein